MRWLLRYALFNPTALKSGWVGYRTGNVGNRLRGKFIKSGGPEGSCTLNPPADNGALCWLSYESKWLAGSKLEANRTANGRGGPPSLRFGAAASLLLHFERRLVGSAGNAPVRHFRLCFVTPDLQSGSRITSLGGPTQVVGSGSGSHTHLQKFMRLLSVLWSSFPQLNLVESVGNAPTSTCLQSRCIACLPRPQMKNGKLPPCRPE